MDQIAEDRGIEGRLAQGRGLRAALAWIVARALFPVVVVGALLFAITQIEAGVAPATAIGLPTLFAYLIVGVAERLFTWEQDWLHSKGDLKVDIGHLVVSGLLTIRLLEVPIRWATIALAAWLSNGMGLDLWPTSWNLWAQLAWALVFGELFMYWTHRLSHQIDWLWRFHAMHHSAPRLYFLNAVRFHPVDIAISNFAPMIPLLLLGADDRVIALFGLFSAVHGLFQHANVGLHLGPLNWIFSMAELHRWHHSRLLEESNTNFGQNLIVWDIVFGTRFLPQDRKPPRDIGIAGLPTFPMDYWGQLLSPLRWNAIKASSERAQDPGSL